MSLENQPRDQDPATNQQGSKEQSGLSRETDDQRPESKLIVMDQKRQHRVDMEAKLREEKRLLISQHPTLANVARNIDDDVLYMDTVDNNIMLAIKSYKSHQARYFIYDAGVGLFLERLKSKANSEPMTFNQMRTLALEEQERKDLRN